MSVCSRVDRQSAWPAHSVRGRRLARIVGCIGTLLILTLGLTACGSSGGPTTSAPRATATPHATQTARGPLAAKYASYKVGAYYFSGWSHGPNNNIASLAPSARHGSEPLIGWYDDSQAQVDRNIEQAVNGGIDFFAFDWYDVARSPYITDRTLNEGLGYYLTSRQRHHLQFCINFIDQAPFIPRARDWPALVKRWIDYFKQPDYLRVAGKPLFIVFSPEHMRDIFGGSPGVRQALDELRASARSAGLPGVTVAVAATIAPHSLPIHVQQLDEEHYDAATGYNYHAMGGETYNVPVPYARLVGENEAMWNRVATRVPLPYMPVITSGWDQRFSTYAPTTSLIYAGRTPGAFACYAVRARHWVDTHPSHTTQERVVLVFAWNEMGEGGAIIPNHQDHYGYVNALRDVFGAPGLAPTTPANCQ